VSFIVSPRGFSIEGRKVLFMDFSSIECHVHSRRTVIVVTNETGPV
jgi:hypothetical protein